MALSENNLLDEISRFLENDQELYGPAYITAQKPQLSSLENEKVHPDSRFVDKQGSTLENQPPDLSAVDPDRTDQAVKDDRLPYLKSDESVEKNKYESIFGCQSLDELKQLCLHADELKTDLEDTQLVFGTGNPHADLMLIGEAPGEQEDREGVPFVGAAGQLLTKILAAIRFKREDVYIANILKHRPPGNRNPNPDERTRSLPYLLRQIQLVEPKLILCLGKVSANTLLENEISLKEMRGNYYPFHGSELTVTYHPAALLRNPQWKRPVWEDVQKLRKRYDELGCKP